MIRTRYPHKDPLFLNETLKLKFSKSIQMLIDPGYKTMYLTTTLQDLSTKAEQVLGCLVGEKYHTHYYILGEWNLDGYATAQPNPITTDRSPASARSFYTMPNQENPSYSTPMISSPTA